MVVKPDAIVDPRAVMIKSFDTFVADAAVAGSVGANHLTVGTEEHWVKNLHHLHEGDSLGTF